MGRKLGQHFLKDKNVLRKIVSVLDLRDGDTVLEIGAGHGELTKEILAAGKRIKLIAVEKDKKLVECLRKDFPSASFPNLLILEEDILKIISSQDFFVQEKINKVVGNIPYYLTGHLLRKISELERKPSLIVFLLQKEVALRICAQPPKMNLLAASIQFWADPRILFLVKRGSFSPPPRVESVVISLRTKKLTLDRKSFLKAREFFNFIRVLFKQPRKTIVNNLMAGGYPREKILSSLSSLGLKENLRPQQLSLNLILDLLKRISEEN